MINKICNNCKYFILDFNEFNYYKYDNIEVGACLHNKRQHWTCAASRPNIYYPQVMDNFSCEYFENN